MATVLIICTANICRSPFAEAILRQRLQQAGKDDWVVQSAGTWAEWERGPARYSIALAEQQGLDITDHRARMISEEIMEESDLVLCMTTHHAEALRAEFRRHRDKIYMLSEMVGRRFDVVDPYGQAMPAYDRMGQEVTRLIDEGLSRIIELASAHETARA